MRIKIVRPAFGVICLWIFIGLSACQTSSVTEGTSEPGTTRTETSEADTTSIKRLSPDRVDIRGYILRDRYSQGQVTIEVEGVPSQNTRYNRAVVLVQPTTQIIGIGGKPAGQSDLRQGQMVSILLRAGGRGNQEGVGIARKVWLEESL